MKLKAILMGVGLVASCAAVAQDDAAWGLKVSYVHYTDNTVRDLVGRSPIGIGISRSQRFPDDWRFTTDIDLVYSSDSGNRLLLVPVTVGFSRAFGEADVDTRPYVAVRGGIAYADYSLTPTAGTTFQTRRGIPTLNAEVGVILDQRLSLSARYDWYSETDGLKFDGIRFTVAYHFIRF